MKPQLENGYTRLANEIVEEMCRLKISNYESRFLWCLFRKTYGFGKKQDYIALSQFSKLSGIESQHIARTKTKLASKNIITVSNGKIGFQKDVSKWVVPNEVVPIQVVPKQVRSSTQTGSQLVPKQVDTKETLTKETIQKKETSPTKKENGLEKSLKDELDEENIEKIARRYGIKKGIVFAYKEKYLLWVNEEYNSKIKMNRSMNLTVRKWIRDDIEKYGKPRYMESDLKL
jgi:phage replication O-like protein O